MAAEASFRDSKAGSDSLEVLAEAPACVLQKTEVCTFLCIHVGGYALLAISPASESDRAM
ncbi:hypothetical protein ARMSODRAFT_958283 [Armillaria solidipes]|uniref:Uncharacterized protein n=1 Tax=Armillaria solidipes TaxID=1076256 RepID=A0A2H3BZZ7_9AGAR|nr:hypothetical protein ARMSODRAFT_958283 [Armillaria solidipes]